MRPFTPVKGIGGVRGVRLPGVAATDMLKSQSIYIFQILVLHVHLWIETFV